MGTLHFARSRRQWEIAPVALLRCIEAQFLWRSRILTMPLATYPTWNCWILIVQPDQTLWRPPALGPRL